MIKQTYKNQIRVKELGRKQPNNRTQNPENTYFLYLQQYVSVPLRRVPSSQCQRASHFTQVIISAVLVYFLSEVKTS